MAHPLIHYILAGGAPITAPKLLIAIGDYADGTGRAPQELVDVSLAERFHWTFDELDEQDDARILPAVAAANIYQAYHRYIHWVEAAAQNPNTPFPSDEDGRIWRAVIEARQKRDE